METVRHRKELLMNYIIIFKRSEIYKIIKSKGWWNPPILITICNSRGVLIEIMNSAHRDSLTESPENTISSIKKAWEHGAKGIELDLQCTRNPESVIIHKHNFTRIIPGVPGKVNDYTLGEIQLIDVGSAFSKSFTGERLATLDEVLDVVPREVILNIEIKNIPLIHEGIESILLD